MNYRHVFRSAIGAGTFVLVLGFNPISLFAASSAAVGLGVTASVTSKCLVSATSTVAFGNYDPVQANSSTGSDLDGQGTVTIRCTPGDGVSIALDQGANFSSPNRRMAGPSTSFLNYELYQEAARTNVWGNGSTIGTVLAISASTNNNARNFNVYGRIPKGQDPGATGSYSDTVQATVNF
jgi:spore coat protein U domain-containing protein, fimbrial subunit CupE1/2/3/6